MKKTMERYGTKTGPRRTLAIFLTFALAFSFAGITGAGGMVATAEATDSSTAPGASKADEARPFESNAEDAEPELGGGENPDSPSEAGQGAAEGGGLEGADGSAGDENPAAGLDEPSVGELPSFDAPARGDEGIPSQSLDDEGEGDEISLLSTLEASDFASLRAAISSASSGETVSLKADILVTAQINLGSTAKGITIDGSNPDGDDYKLIRDSGYAGYLIRVDNGNGLTLSNVTMDGQGISGARAHVYLTNGSLVLGSGSVLENSRSAGHGGAVNAIGGSVTVQGGAVVRNNTAVSSGGGIYANGGTVSLEPGSLVTGNSTNGDGGGINVYNATGASSVGFSMAAGATVSGNRANNGGGVVVRLMRSDDFATVDGTISGNSAANHGGGLYLNPRNAQAQSLSLAGTVLEGNSADGAGGGLYVASSKPVDSLALTGVTASSNTAKSGGGMFLYHRDAPQTYDLTVVGSQFSNNIATDNGGGLYAASDGALDMTVLGTTVNGNGSGSQGGGLWAIGRAYSASSLSIGDSSVVSGNESANGGGVYYRTLFAASTFTLSGGSRIEGNTASASGGGILLQGLSGGFMQAVIEHAATAGNKQTDSGGNGGGAVMMNSVDLSLGDGSILSGNSAAMRGGAVMGASATVSMASGSQVTDNSAEHNGGGFFLQGSSAFTAEAGSLVQGNKAINGGGVFASGSSVDVAGSVIGNEASSRGGGILVTNEGSLSVRSDSLVERNVVSDGGGVAVVGYAQGAIAGTIENNKASQYGGGVFFGFPWNSSPAAFPASIELTLEPTARIAGNEAVDGAGLYATGPANGQTSSSVAMNGGAIEGNAASGNGGGVYVSNATYDVNAGSIAGNSSETGLGHDLWVAPESAAGSAADGGIANLHVGDAAFTDSADRDKVLIGAGTSGSINFLESFAMKNHLLLQNVGADRSAASVALGKTLTLSGKLTLGVGDGAVSHRLTIDPDGGSVLYKNDAEAEGVDVLTGEVVADMYAMPRNAASVYLQWPEAGPDRVGESFRGWNDDGTMLPNRGVGSIEVSGDTTATALWGEFSVQYFDEDGATPITGIEPTSYAFGAEETVLPTPTKDGHAFVGWYESADHSGSPVTSFSNADQEDKAYFAKWKETPIPPGPDPDPDPDPEPDPDPAPVPDPSSDTGGTRLPGPAASGKGMAATGDSPLALVGLGALALLAGTALLFVKRRNG